MGIERWGGQDPKSPLLYTVMNRSTEAVNAIITIDLAALQRTGAPRVLSLLDRTTVKSEQRGQQLVLEVRLGADQAKVFELQDGKAETANGR